MLFDPEGPQNFGSLGEMPPMMPLVEPPELEPIFAKARARIDATDIPADYVWAVGNPADKIAATARDRDARMVVLAASHHGFFGRMFGTDSAAEVERELGARRRRRRRLSAASLRRPSREPTRAPPQRASSRARCCG